jgi:hypothetical protein
MDPFETTFETVALNITKTAIYDISLISEQTCLLLVTGIIMFNIIGLFAKIAYDDDDDDDDDDNDGDKDGNEDRDNDDREGDADNSVIEHGDDGGNENEDGDKDGNEDRDNDDSEGDADNSVIEHGDDGGNENEDGASNDDEYILIGVTGRKRSGKDTIGQYLVDDYGFVRIAFADALKDACINVFGFSREQVYGDELKEQIDEYWQHTPREILQKVGTDLFRNELPRVCENISNDIWIKSVERKIQNLKKIGHNRFVITDVRFPNELEFIHRMKGRVWKVVRPCLLNDANQYIPVHSSESHIDGFASDKEFLNDGTIVDLYQSVEEVLGNFSVDETELLCI